MLRSNDPTGTMSAYAQNVASKINERAKASTSASCIYRVVEEEKEPLRFAQGSSSTSVNLHRCNLKKGKTLFHSPFFFFCIFFFLSATLLLKWVGASFKETWLRLRRRGTLLRKYRKKLKEMAKLENPTSFPAASFHTLSSSFILLPFRYFIEPRCCQIIRMDDKRRQPGAEILSAKS